MVSRVQGLSGKNVQGIYNREFRINKEILETVHVVALFDGVLFDIFAVFVLEGALLGGPSPKHLLMDGRDGRVWVYRNLLAVCAVCVCWGLSGQPHG